MKKLLLSFTLMGAVFFYSNSSIAQCNTTDQIKKYDNTNTFTIDGQISDWQDILGLVNTGTDATTNPYNPSSNRANWSKDGLNNIAGSDFDWDAFLSSSGSINQNRNLRFFAFTYDNTNVHFYFRRITADNSNIYYYYFCDIDGDGFMKNGEPVIQAVFTNNSAPSIRILSFIEDASDPLHHTAGFGNRMVSPNGGNIGLADGYSIRGDYSNMTKTSNIPILPALTTGEEFSVATTEGGFGVELAIPWRYLKNWANANSTPLKSGDIFTYHISAVGGNSTFAKADDNAGGCCGGVAVTGQAAWTEESTLIPANDNKTSFVYINLKNTTNISTNLSLNQIDFALIENHLGRSIGEQNWLVEVYKDLDNNGLINASEETNKTLYTWNSGVYVNNESVITYIHPTAAPTISTLPLATASFIIKIVFLSNESVKKATVRIGSNGFLNIPQGPCSTQQAAIPLTIPINIIYTTLPVTYKSFNATRSSNNQVVLEWETAMEENNRGFYVQRLVNGEWKNIGFVFTAADKGNSTSALKYAYKDANSSKGITQYRILQVDMDGKGRYSEVRSIRGEEMAARLTIFPNPSNTGAFSLLFEDATSVRDVIVSDVSGRQVKQIRGISSNSISVAGLNNGFYTVQVVNHTTGAIAVEKVIIKKR